MPTVTITSPAGEDSGTVELPAAVFDAMASIPLMHQVVVAQLAAARQGTHSTRPRGEVSGGGKKPYRQKGTGRARQGSTRAPQFAGGGISHGPQPHGYAQRTPKKMKAAALRGALSDRARNGRLHVLSALVDGDSPSTKTARKALAAVASSRNVLVVLSRPDEIGWLSLRNLPEVHLLFADQLNTYDVLVADDVVFTKAALDDFLSFQQPGDVEAAAEVVIAADAVEQAEAIVEAIEEAEAEEEVVEDAEVESAEVVAELEATDTDEEDAK